MLTKLLAFLIFLAGVAGAETFHREGYESAQEAARQQKKWLLVDSTASWCGPCKKMDKTTWVDPKVQAWLQANAVAVQVDVDAEKALSERLGIKAMPTLIVFSNGKELDRSVGYKSPDELLTWLNDLKQGLTEYDRLLQKVAQGDRQARQDVASYLFNKGDYQAATTHYLWLWDKGSNKDSLARGEIARLVEQSPAARATFQSLRDQRKSVPDWFHLSLALGDSEAILQWYPSAKPAELALVRDSLLDLLFEKQRWAEAGALVPDPVAEARRMLTARDQMLASAEKLLEDHRALMVRYARTSCLKKLVNVYEASLASRQLEAAQAVRDLTLKEDSGQAQALDLVETKYR